MLFEMLRAILYGIVEGITEWLPVSSTGHLIILDAIPALEIGTSLPAELRAEFCEMFEVVIQLGAILAVFRPSLPVLTRKAPQKPGGHPPFAAALGKDSGVLHSRRCVRACG